MAVINGVNTEGKFKIWAKSLCGIRHKRKNMMCQDQYICKEANGNLAVALIDGIGTSNINAMAGKRIVELIVDFFNENTEEIKNADEYVIAFNLMREIQRLLDKMSREYKASIEELSSTLLGIYINPQKNYYMTYHLGDGVIAVLDDYENMRIVSEPQNGSNRNETILITSEKALKHMRVSRFPLEKTKAFMLATDGFYDGWEDKNKLEEIFVMDAGDIKIKEEIDDQTVIKISLNAATCE